MKRTARLRENVNRLMAEADRIRRRIDGAVAYLRSPHANVTLALHAIAALERRKTAVIELLESFRAEAESATYA